MRKIAPFILIIFFCVGQSSAQLNVWRWQNPIPVGNYLHAVQVTSSNTIVVCGDNACFMRSNDGGLTWIIQNTILGRYANLYSLSFLDVNYGMCCGDSGMVIKTTDGGSSWQILNTNQKDRLTGIVVVDNNIAVAVTNLGNILRTTDGGDTWAIIPYEGSRAFYSIRKLQKNALYISGYGGILLRSTNVGLSWDSVATRVGNSLLSSSFTGNNTGLVIGDAGIILHTSDGGISWIRQRLLDSSAITVSLNGVGSIDPNILAIVGDHGMMLFTTNGGKFWNKSDIGTSQNIAGISFFDTLNAIAVGQDGAILRTTNGGKNWVFLPQAPELSNLYSIAFPKGDTSVGLGVGKNGIIKRTTDGGKTWSIVSSGTKHTLRGITFIDSVSVIAVGDLGTIIKSTDAGLSWNTKFHETNQNLYSVSFATPNDGLVVGDSNTCLKTYNAGEFWTFQYVATPPERLRQNIDYFNSVSYPDKMHAFMIGFHAYYISHDGGINWKYGWNDPAEDTAVHFVTGVNADTICESPSNLISISFADSLHGALLRSYSPAVPLIRWYVVRTSDGGLTWDSTETQSDISLNDIQFVDKLHATVVGAQGYIIHTSDGGKTFIQQASNTTNDLYGVCFGTLNAGTAVGLRGNILRITTNEVASVHQNAHSDIKRIIIDQNYPNPASHFTTVNYSLPTSGIVAAELFSIDGVREKILIHEFQNEGNHTLSFNAAQLSAGTYIIRINSGGFEASRELTVIH